MLIAFSQMKGSSVEGMNADGNEEHLGSLKDLLFDGGHFVVRYVTVDLGKWLPGREVPIRPMELVDCQWQSQSVLTKLQRATVEASPEIDVAIPVSRQMEIELAQHYEWSSYWGADIGYGPLPPAGSGVDPSMKLKLEAKIEATHANLRTASEVMRAYVHETDGELGSVYDLIVDDEFWVVRYVVLDLGKWLPGRKVLVASSWIKRISWSEKLIYVDLTKSAVEHSPAYDASGLVNRSIEEQLYDYHDRPAHWK